MSTARNPVAVGKPAPDFQLQDDQDRTVSLSDFRGKPLVLFFYPKDDTPGCTAEACSFRDALPRFGKLDAAVVGVSPDSPRKHRNFKKKYDLPYTLLSDTDHKLAEAWGLWVEKLFWGRKYWGVARTTFIIDAKGRVAKIFENVKPEDHAAEVAEAVAALK